MRQPSRVALALLLAAVMSAIPWAFPSAVSQGAGAVFINVVSAADAGCSPDRWTEPDLRVRVFVDGELVLETLKAQDQRAPLYATLVEMGRSPPFTVGVEIDEAEPGGFFLLGTEWKPCDASPEDGNRFEMRYTGGTQEFTARGTDANAAQAWLVVGPGAPAAPTVRVVDVTVSSATLAWDANPRASAHRVAGAGVGAPIATVPAPALQRAITDLCDNQEYAFRVVLDAPPWHVTSADVTFTTLNAPPRPPRVLSADPDGTDNITVSWESFTTHDVTAYEIHAGPGASFLLGEASLRAHVDVDPTWGVDPPAFAISPGDSHVVVRAIDSGGLSAASGSFPIGAPAQTAAFPPATDACGRGHSLPPSPTSGVPGRDASPEPDSPREADRAREPTPPREPLPPTGPPREPQPPPEITESSPVPLIVLGLLGVVIGVVAVLLARPKR